MNKPETTFKELAAEVFRNATQNEALSFELLRALENSSNLRTFETALQDLALNLLNFLDKHAQ